MARSSIPVDLFNPGQVFACLGFVEAAEVLVGATQAEFDWSSDGKADFHLGVEARRDDPFTVVLQFLAAAEVRALAPPNIAFELAKWRLESDVLPGDSLFPQPAPATPAALPAMLSDGRHTIVLDSWGDATSRDNVKFWAGAGGYPGAALIRDALDLVRPRIVDARQDPFALAAAQKSSLRFDWRRDYVPLGAGFSLNEHGNIVPLGYPLVEVLAAIGLAHARPERPDRWNKLEYRYAVAGGIPLPAVLHRAALGCADLPFPTRVFRMTLAWPGKENQARCITSVTEDPTR